MKNIINVYVTTFRFNEVEQCSKLGAAVRNTFLPNIYRPIITKYHYHGLFNNQHTYYDITQSTMIKPILLRWVFMMPVKYLYVRTY